jgi:LysR family hydrogen peroxide-inducible transcriptional activator
LCGRGADGRAAGSDISATSLETLFHLAAAGYGVTLAPRLAIESRGGAAIAGLAARPFVDRAMKRNVTLAFRRDTSRRAALARFAASVRAATPVFLRETTPPAASVKAKAKAARRKQTA